MSGDERLETALAELDSAYLSTRLAAIQRLGDAKYAPALPRLIEIAGDQNRDERTRAGAIRALGKFGALSAVPVLIRSLKEVRPNMEERDPTKPAPETVSLGGVLLSVALPTALRTIGSPEAVEAVDLWRQDQPLDAIVAKAEAVVQQEKMKDWLERIRSAESVEAALQIVLEGAAKITGSERAFVAVREGETNEAPIKATLAFNPSTTDTTIAQGVVEEVLHSSQPVLTDNVTQDSRYQNQQSISYLSLRSIIAAPLTVGNEVIGVVYADNRLRAGVFKQDDLALLSAYAQAAGEALQTVRERQRPTTSGTTRPELDWFSGDEFDFTPPPSEAVVPEAKPLIEPPAGQLMVPEPQEEALPPSPPAQPPASPPPAPGGAPVGRVVPTQPGAPQAAPARTAVATSSVVQFSAYYPKTMRLDDWQPLYAYVFREQVANAVVADAFAQLGKKQAGYSSISQPARLAIAEGAQITATPSFKGFQFNPLNITVGFYDDWARFDFRLRAKDAPLNQFATGSITFTVEGVIVGDVPLSVYIGEPGGAAEINSAVARAYQAIFCSYSHQDTAIVERVERAYKALGLDYLRDVTTLKSGEHWSSEILELIDKADIFQLFWSKSAAESPYVRQEWQHALRQEAAKPSFIRPVWWKTPMPPVPAELSHIHFAYQPDLERG
ncbi:MAG: GAF domain-containing protein [bacterium]|nr:GAF domain-containing protein [bacterium]